MINALERIEVAHERLGKQTVEFYKVLASCMTKCEAAVPKMLPADKDLFADLWERASRDFAALLLTLAEQDLAFGKIINRDLYISLGATISV